MTSNTKTFLIGLWFGTSACINVTNECKVSADCKAGFACVEQVCRDLCVDGTCDDVPMQLSASRYLASAEHTLAAANHAGTGTSNVTLKLPELDGDELIDRINDSATTGVIDRARVEPPPFASYRGYIAANVTFNSTLVGLINPTTDFTYGITESGGDITVSQAGVYHVTAVARLAMQNSTKGRLMVSHLNSTGSPIVTRFELNDNDHDQGPSATLSGSTLFEMAAGDRLRFEVGSASATGSWTLLGNAAATASETVVTVQLVHP